MLKLWRIFLLYSQHALEYKARSFVWFLVTLIDAALYLLFWRGALSVDNSFWNLSSAVSYYLLLIIAGCLLQVHIEEEVAFEDIQLGWLSMNLTKPFSYYWLMFCRELPWRVIQGTFGIIVLIIVLSFYKFPLATLSQLPFILLIVFCAYFLTFTYKMIVGFSAFWVTNFVGLHNMEMIVSLLFGGHILPLVLLPSGMKELALVSPFAYMVYYPVVAFQGKIPPIGLWQIIVGQLLWLLLFLWIYKKVWSAGLKRYTAVGQ